MEIKEFKINENKYTFVCETWSNSRSWGHEVNLMRNNYHISKAKITYINRTWEHYQYQTTMLKAISLLIEEEEARAIEYFKAKNSRSRLKKEEKEKIYKENKTIKELLNLRDFVRGKVY